MSQQLATICQQPSASTCLLDQARRALRMFQQLEQSGASANGYTEVDAVFTEALRLKGNSENLLAARGFKAIISYLEKRVKTDPSVDTIDRLEEAREFLDRTEKAEVRRLANLRAA